MWQSLKEYVTSLGRWGWVVIIDFILAGTGAYLDITNAAPIPMWVWITLGLVGLMVAPFIAFHKLRCKRDEIRTELDDIRNAQPLIEVTPKKDNRDIYLDVYNVGEYAEFEAQVEVLEGKSYAHGLLDMYSAYWDRTKRDKTKIMKGHRDRLNIATLEMNTRVLSACFRLHYYETRYFEHSPVEGIMSFNSTSWIPGSDQVVKPCFKLKVTISSNPSMKDGAFSRVYELSPEGFSEISA
jgi:hypothetical protein